MARHIDADALNADVIQRYTANADVCLVVRKILGDAPTADVVPRSEVDRIFEEIEKTIRGALVLIGFSYKHNPKEIQCRKECYEDFLGYVAELKKKYLPKEE